MTKSEALKDFEGLFGVVPGWVKMVPEAAAGPYWELFKAVGLGETKIPAKYKRLIGVAVASVLRCDYCSFFQTEGAKAAGASPEEVREATVLAGLVSFSSTYLNGSQYDLETFKRETLEMLEGAKKRAAVPPK